MATTPRAKAGSGNSYRIRLLGNNLPASGNVTALVAIVAVLVIFGLLMVFSSSAVEEFAAGNSISSKFIKQAVFAVVGTGLLITAWLLPPTFWTGNFAWFLLLATVILQLLVFTPLGLKVQGNRAWLNFGVITVQPAEFGKVALVLWLGMMMTRLGHKFTTVGRVVITLGIPVAVVLGLALLGGDLGTVLVLGALVIGALWFGGLAVRYLIGAGLLALLGAAAMAIISPNRVARITSFLSGNCDLDYEGLCWQTSHGFFALARGGVFGVGLGNSTAKWSWLPEADNDFIFAIIGEEFGLLGALAVIILFALFAFVLLRIWRDTKSPGGRVIVGGVLSWFIFQGFVNIAVVLGLLPVLGVPLPLLSSGGSALVTSLFAIGLVLSVARDNEQQQLHSARKGTRP